jgi:hypothetical protein
MSFSKSNFSSLLREHFIMNTLTQYSKNNLYFVNWLTKLIVQLIFCFSILSHLFKIYNLTEQVLILYKHRNWYVCYCHWDSLYRHSLSQNILSALYDVILCCLRDSLTHSASVLIKHLLSHSAYSASIVWRSYIATVLKITSFVAL